MQSVIFLKIKIGNDANSKNPVVNKGRSNSLQNFSKTTGAKSYNIDRLAKSLCHYFGVVLINTFYQTAPAVFNFSTERKRNFITLLVHDLYKIIVCVSYL